MMQGTIISFFFGIYIHKCYKHSKLKTIVYSDKTILIFASWQERKQRESYLKT